MARRRVLKAPATTPAGRPSRAFRASEIDVLVAIEGRSPAAAVRAVARQFRLSEAAARSWITRLRKRELLRIVAMVDRARCGAAIESVAYIRVDWSHPGASDLEPALRDDPAVTEAAFTFGPFDYTVFAIHDDQYEAAAWSRRLQALPYVSWCRVDRLQTRFKRFACAATLLTSAGAQ
jgi:DNA-binding Lrp family transcriptional regulator